jgi:ribulose-phosphate 3-epimerase
MDGHFVPNLTLGPKVAKDLKAHTSLPIRAHLMVSNPDRLLEPFAQAGVSSISVHQEACPHLHRTLSAIHALGLKAGVALSPATPVCTLEEVLPIADFVLIMSVNPGFGGQGFIPGMLEKIQKLKRLLQGTPRPIRVAVDGGINATNAADVVKAGADTLIVGSSLFAGSLPLAGALETFEEVFYRIGNREP